MILGVMGKARHGKDSIAEYLSRKYGFVRIGLADPMKRVCKDVFDFSYAQLHGNERDLPDPRYLREKAGSNGATDVRSWLTKNGKVDFSGSCFAGLEGLVQYQDYDGALLATLPSPPKDVYLTPRFALQTLGTEWGRACYRDVWVNLGIRTAQSLLKGGQTYDPWKGLEYRGTEWPAPTGAVFSDLRFLNEFNAVKAAGGLVVRVIRENLAHELNGVENHASEMEQESLSDSEFDAVLHNDVEGDLEVLYRQVDHFMERMKTTT